MKGSTGSLVRLAFFTLILAAGAIVFFWLRGKPPERGSSEEEPPDLGIGMALVRIEPGSFLMGVARAESERERDEVPQRRVHIARGFWIGACEVTQREWRSVMSNNP